MKSLLKLLLALAAISGSAYAQNKTVYITAPDHSSPEEEHHGFLFSQLAFSLTFNANPNRDKVDAESNDNGPLLVPGGFSIHSGYGVHLNKWAGLSANTGIDWRFQQKLFSVPVYGMLTLNPHFDEENSVFLQAGVGQAFALGRGSLNGTYQKYRLGILLDSEILLYIDASLFGYPIKNVKEAGIFTIGVALLNFD